LAAPYDDLARQIGEAAYKVTDEQVAKVVEQVGSERAAFELIVASALGAGLHLWRRGIERVVLGQKNIPKTFALVRCDQSALLPYGRLAKPRDHLHDRCGGSLWLVKFDVVAALIGDQLLAMG
jgi:hypothetical protein